MFPSNGTPGGCGIGVVIVIYAAKIGIGTWDFVEERTGVAKTGGGWGGGGAGVEMYIACTKSTLAQEGY